MELRRISHVSFLCINEFRADRCGKLPLRSQFHRQDGSILWPTPVVKNLYKLVRKGDVDIFLFLCTFITQGTINLHK
jgi:hypothetical protein